MPSPEPILLFLDFPYRVLGMFQHSPDWGMLFHGAETGFLIPLFWTGRRLFDAKGLNPAQRWRSGDKEAVGHAECLTATCRLGTVLK